MNIHTLALAQKKKANRIIDIPKYRCVGNDPLMYISTQHTFTKTGLPCYSVMDFGKGAISPEEIITHTRNFIMNSLVDNKLEDNVVSFDRFKSKVENEENISIVDNIDPEILQLIINNTPAIIEPMYLFLEDKFLLRKGIRTENFNLTFGYIDAEKYEEIKENKLDFVEQINLELNNQVSQCIGLGQRYSIGVPMKDGQLDRNKKGKLEKLIKLGMRGSSYNGYIYAGAYSRAELLSQINLIYDIFSNPRNMEFVPNVSEQVISSKKWDLIEHLSILYPKRIEDEEDE